MKITIESTTKIVQLNGVPARVWQGKTESGIEVHCFIVRLAIEKNEPRAAEFTNELFHQSDPKPEIEAYPLRMII